MWAAVSGSFSWAHDQFGIAIHRLQYPGRGLAVLGISQDVEVDVGGEGRRRARRSRRRRLRSPPPGGGPRTPPRRRRPAAPMASKTVGADGPRSHAGTGPWAVGIWLADDPVDGSAPRR